jgi:hypothetical protein
LNSGYISAQVISHNRQKLELWDVGKLPSEAGEIRKKRSEQKLGGQYVHLAHNFQLVQRLVGALTMLLMRNAQPPVGIGPYAFGKNGATNQRGQSEID